jgi:hypothetical protein
MTEKSIDEIKLKYLTIEKDGSLVTVLETPKGEKRIKGKILTIENGN